MRQLAFALFVALGLAPALAPRVDAQPVRRGSPGRPATQAAAGVAARPVRADATPEATPEASVTTAEVTAHLRFLASDELMGRRPGTPGAAAAARYIAEQFRLAGAAPAPGTDDYYQVVPMARLTPPTGATLAFVRAGGGGADTLRQGADLIVLSGGPARVYGDAVYVGTGLLAADYGGRDVRGRIVVARVGDGGQASPQAAMRLGARKRALADSLGAAALVELYDAALPWASVARGMGGPRTETGEAAAPGLPHAWARDDGGARRMAMESATGLATGARMAAGLVSGGVERRGLGSPNVAAFIRGTDPRLASEVIALTAHYDHIGTGRDRGAADVSTGGAAADTIFNGARDNATGTVALLVAARALAAAPPRRSVLLIAYTAEEMGLIGSRYFAEHPLVPLARIVGSLNVDTGGISDTSVVTLIGAGRTGADGAVSAASEAFGLALLPDPAPEQGLFDRSDNVALAAKGIPSPTFSPGFRAFTDPGVATYYHRTADNPDANYPFDYLRRFSQAYTRTARLLGDADARMTWAPGDRYEAAGRALYGR